MRWWTCGLFLLFGYYDIVSLNNCVQSSFCTNTFSLLLGIYLGVELLDHMVSPCLTFWETLFHSGCSILHSQQQCMRVPISPNPHQHLSLSIFLMMAIMVGAKWYLTVILICISVMTNNTEHLSMCLLAICMSLEKYLLISFVSIQAHVFPFYCWVVRVLYIFWILETYQMYDLQMFSSFCGLSFHFIGCIFWSTNF